MDLRSGNQSDPKGIAGNSNVNGKTTILDYERQNTRVLVVDDDQDVCRLAVSFLKERGFPVSSCSSGMEAMDLIKRQDFGIVMTDVQLGDFDGMGLLKAAKVINPHCDVIVVTGFPTVETAVTAMRFGAAEYFTKPFNLDQLRKSIDRLVERRILERRLRVEKHQMDVHRFDDETGLFSNRYFHLLLSHEIDRCRRYEHPCGLLLAGIDGLKDLDSEAVHPAINGEHAIKCVARMLRSSCRQIDFIARYAYDEFAILLTESGDLALHAVATRIRHKVESLNSQLAAHNSPMKLMAICGGATFPHSGLSKDLLLSKANEALQRCRL